MMKTVLRLAVGLICSFFLVFLFFQDFKPSNKNVAVILVVFLTLLFSEVFANLKVLIRNAKKLWWGFDRILRIILISAPLYIISVELLFEDANISAIVVPPFIAISAYYLIRILVFEKGFRKVEKTILEGNDLDSMEPVNISWRFVFLGSFAITFLSYFLILAAPFVMKKYESHFESTKTVSSSSDVKKSTERYYSETVSVEVFDPNDADGYCSRHPDTTVCVRRRISKDQKYINMLIMAIDEAKKVCSNWNGNFVDTGIAVEFIMYKGRKLMSVTSSGWSDEVSKSVGALASDANQDPHVDHGGSLYSTTYFEAPPQCR